MLHHELSRIVQAEREREIERYWAHHRLPIDDLEVPRRSETAGGRVTSAGCEGRQVRPAVGPTRP